MLGGCTGFDCQGNGDGDDGPSTKGTYCWSLSPSIKSCLRRRGAGDGDGKSGGGDDGLSKGHTGRSLCFESLGDDEEAAACPSKGLIGRSHFWYSLVDEEEAPAAATTCNHLCLHHRPEAKDG